MQRMVQVIHAISCLYGDVNASFVTRTQDVLVQSAVSWLENALKVADVANSTIKATRY